MNRCYTAVLRILFVAEMVRSSLMLDAGLVSYRRVLTVTLCVIAGVSYSFTLPRLASRWKRVAGA